VDLIKVTLSYAVAPFLHTIDSKGRTKANISYKKLTTEEK
jgi:hypothetical protein